MRALWKLGFALCLAVAQVVKGELSQAELINQLPSCAVNCLVSNAADSPCAPTNKTCTCTNQEIQQKLAGCITELCTIKEALTTKNLTATYCDVPVENLAVGHVLMSNIFGILGGVFLAQRLFFKLWWRIRLSWDDWALIGVAMLSVPSLVINKYGIVDNGLGRDVWTLPFDKITKFGIYFYIMVIIYFAEIMLLKMAVLLFYWRIFTTKGIRRLMLGTMAVNAMWGLSFMGLCAFQCQPIWLFWYRWDGEHHGTCISIMGIIWSNAIISIALDVWMLILPLWQLKGLDIPWKKKVGIGLMFSVGALVTVVSIVRLYVLVKYGNTTNYSKVTIMVVRWSMIEIYVAAICACMPSVRVAFLRMFPRLRDKPRNAPQNGNGKATVNMFHFGYFGQGRPEGQFSQVQTVNGNFRRHSAFGILCEKSFTLAINETDETKLVQGIELDRKSDKSGITFVTETSLTADRRGSERSTEPWVPQEEGIGIGH